MTITDLIHETTAGVLGNKVRSGLTILGIVIGIASVIAMLAIGQGASGSIQSSIQSLGSNLVLVTPGAQRGAGVQISTGRGASQSLTQADADALVSGATLAANVAPELTSRQQVVASGTNTNTSIVGTVPSYTDVRNVQVDEGVFITDQNIKSLSKVAVIGPTTATDLFPDGSDPLGKTIRIKGIIFTIVGTTKSKGGTGFNNPDDAIYIPISVQQKFLTGPNASGEDYVSTISLAAQSTDVMTELQNQVTQILLDRHHISDATQADFSTINQQDIIASASSITTTLTILLASIAGISLIVGGIGIMNMMLTTVTERTREIGLRKAIGAKRHDINVQFLGEAILLTFTGGITGVILGWLIAFAVSYTGVISAQVSLSSILLSFGISAFIGVVFGYYPARRASKLNPIEALRFE